MTIVRTAADERVRKPRHLMNGHTVHLVPEEENPLGYTAYLKVPLYAKALCGVQKGSAWRGSPANVTLLADRWCANCWKKWAKNANAAQG